MPLTSRTITIAAQKGGAGKTTLAVHLAVSAALAGERVALLDADPQGSAVAWARARGAQRLAELAVRPAAGGELKRGIAAARDDGATLIVIDTPPHASRLGSASLEFADLVVVPVRPSVLDLAALPAALALIDAARRRALLVLSAVPPRCAEEPEVRDALAASGRAVAATAIRERADYRRALATGRAVAEFAPRGRAAEEVGALWDEITTLLGGYR